jgi:MOSC domain-containing protein YiiM
VFRTAAAHDGCVEHLSTAALEAGLDHVRDAPPDGGTVELIVCRSAVDERVVLDEGTLVVDAGLTGDTWLARGSSRTAGGSAHPDMQLTVMNARAALLLAQEPDRRKLAGDQLYVDMDIGVENLPPGTRLGLGSAVIEVTARPHTGCVKFAARFGQDALRFVNSRTGRALRLRGLNARIVVSGTVRTGDVVRKLPTAQNDQADPADPAGAGRLRAAARD